MAALITIFCVANLLALPASAGAAKRRFTGSYVGSGGVTAADYPAVFTGDRFGRYPGVGGMVADPMPTESRVKVQLRDVSGRPAALRVFWVKPGKDKFAKPLTVCSGKSPILNINPKYVVTIIIVVGPCGDSVSAPTTGSATFTFLP